MNYWVCVWKSQLQNTVGNWRSLGGGHTAHLPPCIAHQLQFKTLPKTGNVIRQFWLTEVTASPMNLGKRGHRNVDFLNQIEIGFTPLRPQICAPRPRPKNLHFLQRFLRLAPLSKCCTLSIKSHKLPRYGASLQVNLRPRPKASQITVAKVVQLCMRDKHWLWPTGACRHDFGRPVPAAPGPPPAAAWCGTCQPK